MTSSSFGCGRLSARLFAVVLVVLVALLAQAAPSQAAPKVQPSRELQAREAFALGRYQEALELFGKLYAEKLHPTYLRNIGRCHQKLKDPDRALDSFREYLQKAGKITAAERNEIDGYMAEMEALKRQQAADDARAEAAKPAPAVTPVPVPQPVVAPTQSQLITTTVPAVPPPTPFYERGWFWGVAAGVVVVGVVGGLFAAGVFSSSSDSCAGRVCLPAAGGP